MRGVALRAIKNWAQAMATLAELGFWRASIDSPSPLPCPSPPPSPPPPSSHFPLLLRYISSSALMESWEHGHAACRLCPAQKLGCATLTDGVWVWPEGLRHYVETHSVPLPAAFVAHALSAVRANAKVAGCAEEDWVTRGAELLPPRNHLHFQRGGAPVEPLPRGTLAWLRAQAVYLELPAAQ